MLCLFAVNANADITELFKKIEAAIGEGVAKQEEVTAISSYESEWNAVELGPNGIETNCKNLNDYAERDAFNIKASEWTEDTKQFLDDKVERCQQLKVNQANFEQKPFRIEYANSEAQQGKIYIYRAYTSALQKKESDRKAEEYYRNKLVRDECQATAEYDLFKNQMEVIGYQDAMNTMKLMQKKEREIARESGVRNLAVERDLATKMIIYRDYRDAHFKYYKKLGGKAVSADKVKMDIADPCKQ